MHFEVGEDLQTLRLVEKTGCGSKWGDAERAANMNPKRLSHRPRHSVIGQEHVGLGFPRLGQCFRFASVKHLRIHPMVRLQHGGGLRLGQ